MDAYARMVHAMDGTLLVDERLKMDTLHQGLTTLQMEADTLKADLRKTRLNYQATLTENELVKERLQVFNSTQHELNAVVHALQTEVAKVTAERDQMRIGYYRYLRLGGLVPRHARTLIKKVFKIVRRNPN